MESPFVRLDFFGNRTRWFVIGLSVLLFAITNLPWHLDDYDQAKQAFTSFEMVREGHWLYQHTSIARIATKPPLVGWISAALYETTRWWEGAWRLPSFAAAIAILLLLGREASCAWRYGGADCRERVRLKPAEPPSCDAGSHRYAIVVHHFPHRSANLAENSH